LGDVARSRAHCAAAACALGFTDRLHWADASQTGKESIMAWTTPTLVEICIGLEINGYLPAEF
jgi:coenzyme PQQ precursor peptide PqqA